MEHKQVIVVGAGISGLSFARRCAHARLDTMVLEKSHRIGGCLETLYPHAGLLLERGTHSMYRIYTECYRMLSSSLAEAYHPGPSFRRFIDSNGKRTPFWRRFNPFGLFRLPSCLWCRPNGMSLSGYFSTILGQKNFDNLFGPAFDALYCQPAEHYPAALLFKRRDRKLLAHLPKTFFLEGGMSAIISDLAEGFDCRIDHTVSRIDHDGQRFWVTQQGEESPRWSCDALAIATPPTQAMKLLGNLKGFSNLPTIHDSPCASLSLTYRTTKPAVDAGVIGWHNAIYSVVHAKRLPQADPNIDGATIHFRYADIGLDRAVEVACRLLNIEPSDILSTSQKVNRLPALRPAHLSQIAELQKNPYPTLALLGNYFDGFSIEDCVRRSSEEFDRVCQEITGNFAIQTKP